MKSCFHTGVELGPVWVTPVNMSNAIVFIMSYLLGIETEVGKTIFQGSNRVFITKGSWSAQLTAKSLSSAQAEGDFFLDKELKK